MNTCIEPDLNDVEMEMGLLASGIVHATMDLAVATDGPKKRFIEPQFIRIAMTNLRYAARNLGVDHH